MKPHKSFVTDVVIKRNLNRLLYFQKEALYRKRLLFYLIIKSTKSAQSARRFI